jgi:hypothetical protein
MMLLELTVIRQHASAHQYASTKLKDKQTKTKVQDRKRFFQDVSGSTHLGAKVLMVMKFSGVVS